MPLISNFTAFPFGWLGVPDHDAWCATHETVGFPARADTSKKNVQTFAIYMVDNQMQILKQSKLYKCRIIFIVQSKSNKFFLIIAWVHIDTAFLFGKWRFINTNL